MNFLNQSHNKQGCTDVRLSEDDTEAICSFSVMHLIILTAFGCFLLVWRTPFIILRSASVINLLIACSVFGHNSIPSLVCKTALSSGGDLATANSISQLVTQYYPQWPDLALLLRPVIKASCCLLLRSHQEHCCEFLQIPAFECFLSRSENNLFDITVHRFFTCRLIHF